MKLAAACPQTPLGTGKLQRHDAWLQPRPRPRGGGLPLKRQHSPSLFMDIILPLYKVSPSDRVGAVAARRPPLMCPATAGSRSVAADSLPGNQRSSLFLRQLDPPPRCLLSEFLCPSDRAVSKGTPVTAVAVQSLYRSSRHRRSAPRLASCPTAPGQGHREFPAPATRRWGGIWHLPRADPIPPDQDLAVNASTRQMTQNMGAKGSVGKNDAKEFFASTNSGSTSRISSTRDLYKQKADHFLQWIFRGQLWTTIVIIRNYQRSSTTKSCRFRYFKCRCYLRHSGIVSLR